MGKYWTYGLVFAGMSMLFYYMGIIESNPLINFGLNIESFTTTTIWLTIVGAVTAVEAIVVGYFTKDIEMGIMVALFVPLTSFFLNFIVVYVKFLSINPMMAHLIFAPALTLYALTALEWFRGRD